MASRLELHEELVSELGTSYVYFQPPESVKLHYPCIIYAKNNVRTKFANDKIYVSMNEYSVTVVDRDPDSEIADRLLRRFSFCRFDRRYVSDNLYHDVLTLHY